MWWTLLVAHILKWLLMVPYGLMWWIFLIAHILKWLILLPYNFPHNLIANTCLFKAQFSYLTQVSPRRWTMKGSYPMQWFILSAVMLHPFFIGAIADPAFNWVIPHHVYTDTLNMQEFWWPKSKRRPLTNTMINQCGMPLLNLPQALIKPHSILC